jgi:hypothetical protein
MMTRELVTAGLSRIVVPTVYREGYLGGLRALTRHGDPAPMVRALDFCQRATSSIAEPPIDGAIDRWANTYAFLEPGARARFTMPDRRRAATVIENFVASIRPASSNGATAFPRRRNIGTASMALTAAPVPSAPAAELVEPEPCVVIAIDGGLRLDEPIHCFGKTSRIAGGARNALGEGVVHLEAVGQDGPDRPIHFLAPALEDFAIFQRGGAEFARLHHPMHRSQRHAIGLH